jgi:hypothetical protein
MFSPQLLEAVEEQTVAFVTGMQRLTKNLTRNGQGFSNIRLETGTRLGPQGAWTISLQEKLMGTFPELENPALAKLALEMIAALPSAKIGLVVARRWDSEKRAPGAVITSSDGRSVRHEVFLRRTRVGGVDPTDEAIEAPPAPAPVDPTAADNLGV